MGRTVIPVPRGDGGLRFLPSLASLVCRARSLTRLIAAEFVKPFRPGGKNDTADAEAIAVAARQPTMRFVAIKSVEQQANLAWHSVREGCWRQILIAGLKSISRLLIT
jgi:transposase